MNPDQPRPAVLAVSRRAMLSAAATLGFGAVAAACSAASTAEGGPGSVTGRVAAAAGATSGSTTTSTTSALSSSAASAGPSDVAALRKIFRKTAKATMTPGSVMVYHSPQGSLTEVYGARTIGGSPALTTADHFRIGSVTKTFTGTVILQLAQEGKLSLDDPVSRFRKDVPNGRHITIAQLLNMRSGLYNYTESLTLNKALDGDPQRVWTPEELLAMAFGQPPYFAPGKEFHYSNTNTVLLGLIAQKLDEQPLDISFMRRLFEPLGLTNTFFPTTKSPMSTSKSMPQPHPQGYMYGTNVSTMESAALPADQQKAATAGTLRPNDVTEQNTSWAWSAGGAISTVNDLATWVTALGDGSLLEPKWQRQRMSSLQSTVPSNPKAPGYGLAIAGFGPMFGHTGELPGYQAFTGYDPDAQRSLVVLSNLNSAPDGRAVSATIAQALIAEVYR